MSKLSLKSFYAHSGPFTGLVAHDPPIFWYFWHQNRVLRVKKHKTRGITIHAANAIDEKTVVTDGASRLEAKGIQLMLFDARYGAKKYL